MNEIQIEPDLLPANLTPVERYPVLIEIVKKTETLQIRAVAVLFKDRIWESSGSWSAFCRSVFGWDDSYASRMKRASEMILCGSSVTTEAQARVLASINDPVERENVLTQARIVAGGNEPTAASLAETIRDMGITGESAMEADQYKIDSVVDLLREALREVKKLPANGAGRWVNTPHIIADLKNAANALKHARPHGECDEDGNHDASCICGGSRWLPKHVLDRPKGGA